MLDAGALGAILMIGGGIEATVSAANALRRGTLGTADLEAHGAPLLTAFSAPEQQTLPSDMRELLGKLDTPGGDDGRRETTAKAG